MCFHIFGLAQKNVYVFILNQEFQHSKKFPSVGELHVKIFEAFMNFLIDIFLLPLDNSRAVLNNLLAEIASVKNQLIMKVNILIII